MENLSAKQINELFVEKLQSEDGMKKVAQEGSAFIRQKLREVSFARKIVQPQYVTADDLQRSVNYDGMVKIVDIEPDSSAMVVNFRGNPTPEYIMGERFEIPFYGIASADFQKTEEELMAYEMPLTEVIERNSVLDIQRIEDTSFLTHVNQAIDHETNDLGHTTKITGNYVPAGQPEAGSVSKNDFKRLFDILDGNELRCEILLMDSTMFNRLSLYNATTAGSPSASEVLVNGYTYSTLFGRKLVVSNKVSLLANTVYAFTAQDFFGQFLIYADTKFWIEKKKNIITFSAYESIGMGIGNTKSCAKLTLS
jgi:hypothetical protein